MDSKEIEKQLFTEDNQVEMKHLDELWKDFLQLVKGEISAIIYKTWFEPIIPLGYKNNTLTISVPTKFFYEFLEEKYSCLLKNNLNKAFGKGTKLMYKIPYRCTNDENNRPLLGVLSEAPTKNMWPPEGKLETPGLLSNTSKLDVLDKIKRKNNDRLNGVAPIYAINRHRLSTDGSGITTLVAFHTCLLKCRYCINPQTWQTKKVMSKLTPKELYEEVKKDNLYFLATGGGVTFGGGEPCLYSDYIVEFQKICNPKWNLTIETSLWVAQSHIKELLPVIDYWIIDIKDIDNNRYKLYTGSNNHLVIKNLKFLLENGKAEQMRVRVPYIKGFNTRTDVINNVAILRKLGVVNIDIFDYTIPNDNNNKDYRLVGSLLDTSDHI